MNVMYKEGTPISDHINDFQGVLDQLSGMGVKFDDEIRDFGFLILCQTLGKLFEFLSLILLPMVL